MSSIVSAARAVTEARLAPMADEVDASGSIPSSHLAALASSGLFGAALGDEWWHLAEVAETIISGCLATGFVWAQHHGVAVAVRRAGRDDLASALASGEVIAGVSYAGLGSHGATLAARRSEAGWVLSGSSAFVTGWTIMGLIGVWAHDEQADEARMFLIERPDEVDGIVATDLDLVAAQASNTVTLAWDDVHVDDAAEVTSVPAGERPRSANLRIRMNASLALGICASALREFDALAATNPEFAERATAGHRALIGVRDRLDTSLNDAEALYRHRAEANELAMRLATAVAAATGSRSALARSTASRLVREALFCAVCAGRPAIRDAMLTRLL
ncbi:acyl-CoA dehydrogenase family protein [Williamsia sp. MIQD14]|uniref:acyl-CoA dehydrogenase family protein n=1 Tax=Williamsia sp. MIQD14 TaxID=3425703 RepID=UPI003DA03ABA